MKTLLRAAAASPTSTEAAGLQQQQPPMWLKFGLTGWVSQHGGASQVVLLEFPPFITHLRLQYLQVAAGVVGGMVEKLWPVVLWQQQQLQVRCPPPVQPHLPALASIPLHQRAPQFLITFGPPSCQ